MSTSRPSGQQSATPWAEPYRGAYVKHNLKKNKVPTIVNFRNLRTVNKVRRLEDLPRTEDISGNGEATITIAQTTQGKPCSDESVYMGQERLACIKDSAGLANKFSSSLVFSDSDNLMEELSEVTDEEFISADEGSDETITAKHIDPHRVVSSDNVTNVAPPVNTICGTQMPTHSLDFNLPRARLSATSPAPVVVAAPSGADDQWNGSQVIPPRADIIVPVIYQNSPNISPGTVQNNTISVPLSTPPIVLSAEIQPYLPVSNTIESTGPSQISLLSNFSLGLHGQGNEPDAVNSAPLAMAEDVIRPNEVTLPMEDVDCAHSGIHSVNSMSCPCASWPRTNHSHVTVVDEAVDRNQSDTHAGQVHEMETDAAENQRLELVRVHRITNSNCHCCICTSKKPRRNDKHGRSSPLYDTDGEAEWEDDGESEVEPDQDSDDESSHGHKYRISRQNENHRSRDRKQASNRTYTPKPFTEAENKFKLSIRLYILELFGYRKPLPIQTPSRNQIVAFEKSQKEVDGPNLETFLFDFEGPTVFTPWNYRLALLLANQYLKEPNSFTSDTVVVQRAFMVCFRYMHRKYKKSRTIVTEDDNIKDQQGKRRNNQSSRQGNLRNRREAAAKRYAKAGGEMKAFSKLWKSMPKGVCSDDEGVTYPDGTKVHEILTPAWRNVAVKVWFRTWDHLAISMRYGPDGKPNPGKFPRVRVEANPVRRAPYARAPPNLPRNFYDDDWYRALDSIEQQKLGAGRAISLAFPPKIVRTAERYEHIKDRKDKPLDPDDPTLTPI